jgi:hypothetical protein
MKIKLFLICLFLLNLSLAKAQKISFIVDKNRDEVINLVSKLQSTLSKDGPFDAIKDDRLFTTTISIKDEAYPSINHKNYLIVKYKNKPVKAMITSLWLINIEKMIATKTRVSCTLVNVTPAKSSAKSIDSDETFSSGKFEKQLKDFVLKK